jgi:hypothetical protein
MEFGGRKRCVMGIVVFAILAMCSGCEGSPNSTAPCGGVSQPTCPPGDITGEGKPGTVRFDASADAKVNGTYVQVDETNHSTTDHSGPYFITLTVTIGDSTDVAFGPQERQQSSIEPGGHKVSSQNFDPPLTPRCYVLRWKHRPVHPDRGNLKPGEGTYPFCVR